MLLSIGYVLKIAGRFKPRNWLFKLFLMLLISSSAKAAQSLLEIHQSSQQFLQNNLLKQGILAENLSISVGYPDKRLRLKKCLQPLIHFMPDYASNQGNTTVGVRCTSPSWQIYLPARIDQMVEMLVSNRNFRKGDVITRGDLKRVKKVKNKTFEPLILKLNQQTSFRAAKNINSGYAITHMDVCQVCKGDQIELRVKTAALTVKMFGIAMKNGLSGDYIPARNSKSKKVVTGKVISQGIIEMKL